MLSTDSGDYCNEWCLEQSKHPTHYAEHNEIRIPEFLQGEGWSDRSYHNDLCARSEYTLPDGRAVQVWVDFDDPKDREEGMPKYTVCILKDEDGDEGTEIWSGEYADEAVAVIKRLIEEAGK
jgi:hypothetical protein